MTHGSLAVVTDSTQPAVSRAAIKTWLRIEEEEVVEDSLIDTLIETATQRYEEYTGRTPIQKTYDYALPDFPDNGIIELPRWPLVSIGAITGYTDTDATDTGGSVMNSTEYYVDTASEPGRVVAFAEYSFPTATRVVRAAIVRFTAGETTVTTGVPSHAVTTIQQMVAHAYEHRGDEDVTNVARLMDEVLRNEYTVQDWG